MELTKSQAHESNSSPEPTAAFKTCHNNDMPPSEDSVWAAMFIMNATITLNFLDPDHQEWAGLLATFNITVYQRCSFPKV